MARLPEARTLNLGRGQLCAFSPLQREDLDTMQDGKAVKETAQRTGEKKDLEQYREKTGEGRKGLRMPPCWGQKKGAGREGAREMR